MISKTQFITLVDGVKKQLEFEEKFNDCFKLLNSSYTVLELAESLNTSIFKIIEEDFGETASDILFEYLYNNETSFEWTESNSTLDYEFEIKEVGELYDMFLEHFATNK